MTQNQVYKIMRKLAKNNYFQTIYSNSKEFRCKIFKNDIDLTPTQITFLGLLNFYSSLFLDIYLKEIEEIVLENEIYEDAYMLYKNTAKKEEPNYETQKDTKTTSQWVFKRPKRR